MPIADCLQVGELEARRADEVVALGANVVVPHLVRVRVRVRVRARV